MIGETLNHYQIIEKLGEGGMAEVYLAEDTRLNRKVALKVLPSELAADPTRIERFEREAKAVAALNHPNIVTIYSVEEANGVRFLTMELVDGRSLHSLISEDGMDLPDFLEVALPLAEAVAAAHRGGVIHRDIKPANVMVNSEGIVKLLDLGLAKLDPAKTPDSSASSADTLTREGRAIGTVPYMAPEQLAGQPIDHRVDIFALGVVLYEMLTGQRPFVGASSAELISSILRDTPKQVTEIKANLPNGLGHTIRRCLEKRPKDRFQTAEDLRAALDAVAASQPTTDSRAGHETIRLKRSPERRSPRSRWLVAAGITLTVALLAGAFFSRFPSDSEAPAEAAALPGLALTLLPLVQTGEPAAPDLARDLEQQLVETIGSVEGLEMIEPAEEDAEGTGTETDYVIEGTIDWVATEAPPRAHIGFEMTRVEDGSVIWSESFERTDITSAATQSEVAATVRARIGRLFGIDVPEAPVAKPSEETASEVPPMPEPATAPSRTESPRPSPTRPAVEQEPTPAQPQPSIAPEPEESTADPPAETQLAFWLTSNVSSGVVTVYADADRIYRREFEFTERKGGVLGRVGIKKRIAGELEDRMLVPAGIRKLRVYIAIAGNPARQFVFSPSFRADGSDRLVVEIRKKSDIDVRIE